MIALQTYDQIIHFVAGVIFGYATVLFLFVVINLLLKNKFKSHSKT